MAAATPTNSSFKKGFPKEIINNGNVDQKYLCALCDLVLRDPLQSFCGHRFCRSCFSDLLEKAGDKVVMCPSCEKEESENEYSCLKKETTFPDNAIKREFLNMKVKCINEGCNWTGSFKSYQQHETGCEFKLFSCKCGNQVPKHQYDQHVASECSHRVLICPYCNANVLAKDMETHNKDCPMFPVKCQFCNKEGMTREEIQRHQDKDDGDCEARGRICPLQCGKIIESDVQSHMNEEPGSHLVLLSDVVSRIEKKLRRQVNEGSLVADAVPIPSPTNAPSVTTLERRLNDIEKLVDKQNEYPQVALGGQRSSRSKSRGDGSSDGAAGGTLVRGEPDGAIGDVRHKIQVTDAKVNTFEDSLAVITQQLDSFRDEADQLHDQNSELKATIEAQDRKIKNLEKTIQLKDLSLAETDLKIQALEQTSYDGILTWKISDFSKKREDALQGRMSSIYSPPFYTGKTGYKMCARLYLNGDGMGKGTHLSLFFVVMKGAYDALLKWPFRQKVTLMLLDQNHHEHIIDAFRPDPNSSSFKRPTSDMNIASGCPLFCQISQLEQSIPAYLRDDCLFIRLIVEASD